MGFFQRNDLAGSLRIDDRLPCRASGLEPFARQPVNFNVRLFSVTVRTF